MAITDYPESTQQEMRRLLRDEALWPHGTLLPIKRRQQGVLECAIVTSMEADGSYYVHHRNVFDPPSLRDEITHYKDDEALFSDGWEID